MAVNKIASELENQMNVMANDSVIPVIVRHKTDHVSAQAILDRSPTADCKFKLFPGEAIKVTPAEIDALSKQAEVDYIWPDLPVQNWVNTSLPKINVPQVWNDGFKGKGIKVAVIDTGLDDTHPDFAGRVRAMKSFVGASARDDNGHGTHVAGILAGSGAKSNGRYSGVAPEASLYIAKVLDARGGGLMSSVMAGIEWAVLDQRVQVINLSLGGTNTCDGSDALSALCDEAVLQASVVICVAAGNAGPTLQTIGPPGCARYVITVGATDDQDKIAYFSSRGPSADGRTRPDLVFPGVDIIAPQATGTQLGRIVAEGYVTNSGTSMAAPHASGMAALLLQANPRLTAEQVKNKMLAGGVNIGALPNEQGAGRGDAFRSYQQVSGMPQPDPTPRVEPTSEPTPASEPAGCLAGLFGRKFF
jgi:serine protease AprX